MIPILGVLSIILFVACGYDMMRLVNKPSQREDYLLTVAGFCMLVTFWVGIGVGFYFGMER